VRSSSADFRDFASQDKSCLLPASYRRALLAQQRRRLSIEFGRSTMTNSNCPLRHLEALYRSNCACRSVALLLVQGASVWVSFHSPDIGGTNLKCPLEAPHPGNCARGSVARLPYAAQPCTWSSHVHNHGMHPTCPCIRHTSRASLRRRKSGTSRSRCWVEASGTCLRSAEAVTQEFSSSQTTPIHVFLFSRNAATTPSTTA